MANKKRAKAVKRFLSGRLHEKLNFKTLRARLMILIVPTMVAALVITCLIGVFFIYKTTYESLSTTLREVAKLTGSRISEALHVYKELVSESAAWLSLMPEKALDMGVINSIKDRNGFLSVMTVDERGTGSDGLSYSARDFFSQPLATGDTFVSDAYYSEALGEHILTMSAPYYKNDSFAGVVVCNLDANMLSDLVAGIEVGDNSIIYMVNSESACIAANDPTYLFNDELSRQILKSAELDPAMRTVWQDLIAQRAGFSEYSYNGTARFAAYSPVSDTPGWSVCVTVTRSDFISGTINSMTITAGVSLLFIVLVVAFSYYFTTMITDKLENCTNRLEKLAQGDLKTPVKYTGRRDEIGRLDKATENLINQYSLMAAEIGRTLSCVNSGQLDITVSDDFQGDFMEVKLALEKNIESLNLLISRISRSSVEVARGSTQIAAAAMQLSQGASEENNSIDELYSTVSSIVQRINRITPASDTVSVPDGETREETLTEQMLDSMDAIVSRSDETKKVALLIENIASETSILALNASVEAARAGGAGKGFAVIATEVRKLAAKSKAAVESTYTQVDNILAAVDEGSMLANETTRSVTEIALALEQIRDTLSQISNVIESTAATSEQTAAASEELSAQSNMLKGLVQQFNFKEM